jgi:hypothetical protein
MVEQSPQRGGCLTAFLLLLIVAYPLLALSYWLGSALIKRAVPAMPDWFSPVMALACLYDFAFAIAIWKWRRWGVFGYGVITVLVFVANLAIGWPLIRALPGLLGFLVLLGLLRPQWRCLR